MDKGKRNSLTPKVTNGQAITPKSSLKKRDSIGNGEEKKVRFTGKLIPEHTPTAKTTPKILVKEETDSNDDTPVTLSGKRMNKQGKVATPSQLSNKQKPQAQPSPQTKLVPVTKNGNVPQSRKRKASDSDDESEEDDEDDDSDDDSDLAALWDESDDDDDDSELDIMEDFFEEDDSEDERPSSVVIEEIKDDKKSADSKLSKKPSVKRRAEDDLEPPSKRPAPAAVTQKVSPAKKVKTEDANNNNKKTTPQKAQTTTEKSGTPKEKKVEKQTNQATVASSNRKSIKKSVQDRLAPYKGKCTPEEYRKLKKKFRAQERKRRSRLEKLQKTKPTSIVTADDSAALIKMSEERMSELRRRIVYVRPIPGKTNAGMLKKALPSITGCRIPPKLATKKGKRSGQDECIVFSRTRGYAFLEFASAEEAKRQLAQLQSRKEPLVASSGESHQLHVRLGEERASEKKTAKTDKAGKKQLSATKRAKACDFKTLHVGGLPCHAQLSQVKELLQCDRVDMPVVANGNLGFCMAHYKKIEDAVNIFREKHGTTFHGSKLWIAFSFKSRTKKVK